MTREDNGTVWSVGHNVRTRLPNGRVILSTLVGQVVFVRWWHDGRVESEQPDQYVIVGDEVHPVAGDA